MTREPSPMSDQITRSHALGRDGVIHLEFRKILPDWLVPIELALVIQGPHRERSKRLADRANGKQGRSGNWQSVFDVTQAETARVDHLPVLHHSDGEPRHLPLLHLQWDRLVERCQTRTLIPCLWIRLSYCMRGKQRRQSKLKTV